MKKILTIIACALIVLTANAAMHSVYVNPLENSSGVNKVVATRFYKKALLGLTKAKTISVATGKTALVPGSPEAMAYDYIMTIILDKAVIEEAGTVGNLLGALSTKNTTPDWDARLKTTVIITNAKTGDEAFKTNLEPFAINKDKELALFNATNNFDYDMTDLTDDAFRVHGEIAEATEVDKKNIVKKVRLNVGSREGARKNQAYELYKVVGEDMELIGAAKCEQVLNDEECILSINGKKDADKIISDLIQNNDGSYTVEAWSRSKGGFLHENFQGLDKMFTNEGRLHYLDPFERTSKPKVAFLAVQINDNAYSAQKDVFQSTVVKGMEKVPTISVERIIYPSVEDARKAGLDGLIEISVDKVFKTTEKDKEGKTTYNTKIHYTVTGIDVANNMWIDMKSFTGYGSSTEGAQKADADALGLMDDRIQKFSEDLFPLAGAIISPEEIKKTSVKKVRINVGTDMGAKKGMLFDIFEQRKEGGAESRFLLGEGTVEKDGLTGSEAILKVKGKNNGDEKLYELLQNADENTEIVLVSRAKHNVLDKGLNFLNRNN